MPSAPAMPDSDVSVLSIDAYSASDVETAAVPAGQATATTDDWFVFEQEQEELH